MQKELADMAGVSKPFISKLIANKAKINHQVIGALISVDADLNLKWLLEGKGDMSHAHLLTGDESELLMMYRRLNNGEKCRQLESLRQTAAR